MGICTKCRGAKIIPEFSHIQGGVCYQCNGTGQMSDVQNHEQPQVCDDIFTLIRFIDGIAEVIQFFVWNQDPNKDNYGYGNYSHLSVSETVQFERHASLRALRVMYQNALNAGFYLASAEESRLFDQQQSDYQQYIEDQNEKEIERKWFNGA